MEKKCDKECCTNCKFFLVGHGRAAWITNYYCTVDGTDRLLGKFDNYTGYATNTARIELDSRCCQHFKAQTDTLEQRYAQLEQVAREMLTEYGDTAHALCVLNPGRSNGKTLLAKLSHEMSIDYRKFRDQLEALGVSLDD